MKDNKRWFLYLLRGIDGSLYTGISTDVGRRLREHNGEDGSRRGAKALRGRRPLSLVFTETVRNRSEASQLEYQIKRLSAAAKEALVRGEIGLQEVALKAQRRSRKKSDREGASRCQSQNSRVSR